MLPLPEGSGQTIPREGRRRRPVPRRLGCRPGGPLRTVEYGVKHDPAAAPKTIDLEVRPPEGEARARGTLPASTRSPTTGCDSGSRPAAAATARRCSTPATTAS